MIYALITIFLLFAFALWYVMTYEPDNKGKKEAVSIEELEK